MANDLESMRDRLRDALSDTDDAVWSAGEKDDILKWSVRRLNQRLGRPLDPTAAAQTVTLVSSTYYYSIDSGITHVFRVDWVDTNGDEVGPIGQGSWEVVGDLVSGTAQLHVSPTIVENLGTLRLNGRGRYTLVDQDSSQTAAIPDDYVMLVLAYARAECFRRVIVDRTKFEQWLNSNQTQNTSVNELIQAVNNAEQDAQQEELSFKRWQKPVPARIG